MFYFHIREHTGNSVADFTGFVHTCKLILGPSNDSDRDFLYVPNGILWSNRCVEHAYRFWVEFLKSLSSNHLREMQDRFGAGASWVVEEEILDLLLLNFERIRISQGGY